MLKVVDRVAVVVYRIALLAVLLTGAGTFLPLCLGVPVGMLVGWHTVTCVLADLDASKRYGAAAP